MSNLTAAQYKTELDTALTNYTANKFYNSERGMCWAMIAGVYSHLWLHQTQFDNKLIVPSATALGYRTKAEAYLVDAKTYANQGSNQPPSMAAVNAGSVAAYAYVQLVKVENTV